MILFICSLINAQQKNTNQTQQNRIMPIYQKFYFSYDSEGNQIEKRFEWSYKAKISNPKDTEIKEIKADNIELISLSEEITYYPNTVKDEFYLDWDSPQDNRVVSISTRK
jgi:hypothetical protein